jgi:hypothetical protein
MGSLGFKMPLVKSRVCCLADVTTKVHACELATKLCKVDTNVIPIPFLALLLHNTINDFIGIVKFLCCKNLSTLELVPYLDAKQLPEMAQLGMSRPNFCYPLIFGCFLPIQSHLRAVCDAETMINHLLNAYKFQ